MIWPDVDHGHIWGLVTLGLIILILIIGAWHESRLEEDCITCEEGLHGSRCFNSERSCGHHCNHSWSHEACCWCRRVFLGEEDNDEPWDEWHGTQR